MEVFDLRAAWPEDHAALGHVMYDAIHNGHSLYNAQQRRAWLAEVPQGAAWRAKLSAQQVVLAERAGVPLGFMSRSGDHIDLAFVAAATQGQGVFRALCQETETAARAEGQPRLHTHASLMARPAFEAMGFRVIAAEHVTRAGQTLDRFEMEKTLT